MPIDRKTKQLVFYECDVETVKRVTLKAGETFTREGANQVFERGYRKRQARAILFCLTDRMRFQKRNAVGSSPFRKELTYREIKHFFVFPSNPNVFMLCVVDEVNGKKIYEMFRCRPEDVNTICDLTFKASTDPQNLLRDLTPLRQLSISSRDYGTEQSVQDYNGSREASSEEIKHQEIPNYIPEYTGRMPGSYKVDRGLQNGHVPDSPFIGKDSSLIRQRSVSPPHLKTIRFAYPSDRESKVEGVFSCYELVEPVKTRSSSVEHFDLDNELPNRGIRNPYLNGVDTRNALVEPIQQHKHVTTQSQPEKYNKSNYRIEDHQVTETIPRRYSPVNPVKRYSRVIIEREPFVNPPIRKAMSTTNLNLGDQVTYISYNPIKGISISDCGPMYMYITRYESTRNLTALDQNNQFQTFPIKGYIPEEHEYMNW
ncbi:hypothetical protein D915_001696 [Fasciola hepatica]|uniref:Trematode PH-like domain-containing protein n=1 Tax=Fasciola hepatica TaxID=6192 RepID=A0A4E0RPC0_FASHE|nr:hypothetical protein D915_001696 [Fasciola hepatica]